MTSYLITRLATTSLVFFIISITIFASIHLLPGNVVVMVAGEYATREQIEILTEKLGLNRPFLVQYYEWISKFVRGDLGESLIMKQQIFPILMRRLGRSLMLAAVAAIGVLLLGVGAGIISGVRKGSLLDSFVAVSTYIGMATPEFVSGTLLILVLGGAWFGSRILPSSGYVEFSEGFVPWLRHLILPSITIMIVILAYIMRMTRISIIETMKKDYIRTARLKGLSEWTVIFKHTLKNAMIPTVTLLGSNLPWLVGGIVITENVFAYPGIGRLVTYAITNRDLPLVQASALTIASLTLIGNFMADLSYHWLNPKVRE